jgi:phospholipase/carboxylesterase
MNNVEYCGIDTIIRKEDSNTAIVVLHGYGADNKDFVPFSDYILKSIKPSWYFFNGVLPTTIGGHETGRCWFPIDMVELNTALVSNNFLSFFQSKVPPGLEDARVKITTAIEKLRETYDRVFLGGFSQGSMLSADIAFHRPDLVDKLFLLSSTMLFPKRWEDQAEKKFDFPIFLSHGLMDPILPIAGARELKYFLENYDHDPKYIEFNGAHEVPLNVVNELDLFLRD